MKLFHPANRDRWADRPDLYAAYELAYTAVDFGAAACFVVGSVMFFFEAWQTPGTWLFLIGSVLFAAKPSLRLARELHMAARGDEDGLAQRYRG